MVGGLEAVAKAVDWHQLTDAQLIDRLAHVTGWRANDQGGCRGNWFACLNPVQTPSPSVVLRPLAE
jgi:hypothetical protein